MSAVLDTLRGILKSDPENWQFRLALVEALVGEDMSGEAAAVLNDAPSWPPADQGSQVKAARAYGLLNPADGLGILDGVIAADPTCASAHLEKAVLSFRSGDQQGAKRHYFTAVTFDPGLEDAQFEGELEKAPSPVAAATPGLVEVVAEPVPVAVLEEEAEPAVLAEVQAVEVEESEPEVAEPAPVLEPGPEAAVETADDHYRPSPGGFPVQTLRAALETRSVKVHPLVDPNSIPAPPALVHQSAVDYQETVYTPREEWSGELNNVYVRPAVREEPVVYDYQQPDECLFDPTISPDDIYVAAYETEDGQPVADHLESLAMNRLRRDLQLARQRRRNKVESAMMGMLAMLGIGLILYMIKLVIPVTKLPEIVATTTVSQEKVVQKRRLPTPQVRPAPTAPSSAAPAPMEVITSASFSSVSVPSISSEDAVSLELGTSFGGGAGFGSSSGAGTSGSFFGSQVRGGMAVIFDITGSMYGSNPLVVAEINRKFKSAQVVAVFGATFRDVGSDNLVPYKENVEVLANVDKNGKKSATQVGMNKALFSLSRCDSLSAKGWEIQSLGKAIEALLHQPSTRMPQTIFVFSDFQDGVDLAYMEKVRNLVKRRRTKIVFFHPVAFSRDKQHYRDFADATGGEIKEGLKR